MDITKPSKGQVAFILLASRIGRRFMYRKFVEEIGLEGGEDVLDFGAGWGDNTFYIARKLFKGGRVTALDVSEQWQKVARRRLKGFKNVDFVRSDVRSSPLKDGSFDVIVVSYVLHDIPVKERKGILDDLVRKLKPDGFIQLREPTRKQHGMPINEIRNLMNQAGMMESSSTVGRNQFKARYSRGK